MRSIWLVWLAACAPDPFGFDGPIDVDQDGYIAGHDCDDADPTVGPPTIRYTDADGDGFGDEAVETCDIAFGAAVGGDCDDASNTVFPGAEERCDGVDDNCDGNIDIGAVDAQLLFIDRDEDGYGDALVGAAPVCGEPTGFSANRSDCNDVDPAISPEAIEICGNGVDDNCDPTDCPLRPTLDMANLASSANALGALLTGSVAGAQFGATVVAAGDVNDDGVEDLWVGAPGISDALGPRVFLFLGPLQQSGSASDLASAAIVAPAGVVAGHSIAALGDVDEDGVDDVLIATRFPLLGQGRVHIVRGPVVGVTTVSDASTWSQTGDLGAGYAEMVAAIGDVNGDGRNDFVVGAPDAQAGAGELHIYSSLLDPAESELGPADWVISGLPNDHLGQLAPLNAGDLNGDGLDDLLIPAIGDGGVYVVLASPNPDSVAVNELTAARLTLPVGASGLGISLGHLPDVDGDGLPEFLFGMPAMQGAGQVIVLHSDRVWQGLQALDGIADATIVGGRLADELGTTVAGGDYNGDGIPDVLIGSAGALEGADDGGAVVLRGPFEPGEYRGLNAPDAVDQIVWGDDEARAGQVVFLPQVRAGHLVLGAPNSGPALHGSVGIVYGNVGQ